MYPAPSPRMRLLKSLSLYHECTLFFRLSQKSFSTKTISKPTTFVPKCEPPEKSDIEELQEFIQNNKKVLVLTGAGLSTESGIPDYRSEGVGLYATSDNRPVQYSDFLNSSEVRRRYWARNFVAWPRFSSFSPNISHKVLSEWERRGKVHWLVTQNVDSLHYKAGSKRLTELHGSLHRVHCLNCDSKMARNDMQDYVITMNPTWHAQSSEIAPDGDVSLTQEQVQGFKVPPCKNCGGILKPEIVFFGANVARPMVNFVYERVDECDAVLVAGSSLHVYSGYRFVSRAHDQKKPIAIVNIGQTRADKLSNIKINSKCGDVLPYINI